MTQDSAPTSSQRETQDLRDVIERWETFGGTWRIVEDGSAGAGRAVTVALCRCDGGEDVERVASTDATARRWLQTRAATAG